MRMGDRRTCLLLQLQARQSQARNVVSPETELGLPFTGRFYGEEGSSSVGAGEVGWWSGGPCGRPRTLPTQDEGPRKGPPPTHPPPRPYGTSHFPCLFPKEPPP